MVIKKKKKQNTHSTFDHCSLPRGTRIFHTSLFYLRGVKKIFVLQDLLSYSVVISPGCFAISLICIYMILSMETLLASKVRVKSI